MLNGRVGQVCGPFAANKDLLDDDGAIGMLTPEDTRPVIYKLGIQADTGVVVKINDMTIKIGKTGIYELDEVVDVKTLSFPNGGGDNVIVDFVY